MNRIKAAAKRVVITGFISLLAVPLHAQDAAPVDRNPVNTRARPGDMMADSPVTFPERGALPSKFPPDVRTVSTPTEKGYYLFSSPCRSLAQITAIQAEMPAGEFTQPVRELPATSAGHFGSRCSPWRAISSGPTWQLRRSSCCPW